jgi:hypothetical protein
MVIKMLEETIVIMNGENYLMANGYTVIFDTIDEAKECQEKSKCGGKITKCILFCDKKVNWKELNSDNNDELTDKEICENAISVIEGLLDIIKTKTEILEEESLSEEECIIQDAKNVIEDLYELKDKLK